VEIRPFDKGRFQRSGHGTNLGELAKSATA
jgi:hypothetical protein